MLNRSPKADTLDHPGVLIPPPIIIAALCGVGLLLDRALPAPFPPLPAWSGGILLAASLALAALCLKALRDAKTTLRPDRPNSALVRTGPYRYSRNPIYVAMLIMLTGIAVMAQSPGMLTLVPVAWLILDRYVVRREENYLNRRFGSAYLTFRNEAPRWV